MTKGVGVAEQEADQVVEKFRTTSGRITGALALVLALGVVLIGVLDPERPFPAWLIWGALFGASLAWAAMLRPRLWATTRDLVMRNMISTVSIPLVAIEQIAVRQVVAVRAGERRYVSPAVGRSWRQAVKSNKAQAPETSGKPSKATPYPTFVDDRLHQLTEEARARSGVELLSDEQLALAEGVRREWAWPEIALLAVTGVGLLVSIAWAVTGS